MSVTALDIVTRFAPNAKPAYRQAFIDGGALLLSNGITTPLRLAHFMTQIMHETGGLAILIENGNYSAKNLATMWDSGNWHRYFANRDACIAMAQQNAVDKGETLFSLVYGGRMGNGPPASKDGWRYRGRGMMQTTGRESYRKFGIKCGVDFEGDPDLVIDPQHALKPAADHNDIKVVTYGINGGYVGLAERKAWFAKIWPFVIGAPPVEHSREWKVQAALDALGYDCGNPDGVIGPRTRAAIIAYRAKNGLTGGTQIGADLLLSLKIH
jgi:putative chitinase